MFRDAEGHVVLSLFKMKMRLKYIISLTGWSFPCYISSCRHEATRTEYHKGITDTFQTNDNSSKEVLT